jgi:DNA-binding LacI/PurR family transcriptional regulator
VIPPIRRAADSRVTSIDVARRAGVSQSTVSLVLSGKARGRVSAATAAAVRRAADELGYRPNAAARALRTGAARSVALIVPDVTHPFFGQVMRGAQAAAWEAGYAVMLVDTANDRAWEAGSYEAPRSGPVDGFLLFGIDPPARRRGDRPEHVVVIDAEPPGHPSVRLDSEGGTQAAVEHLLGLGHRRIGHLASAVEGSTFRLRAERLDALLEAAGLGPDARPRARSAFTFAAARVAALDLLRGRPRPTAVFCDDDILAGGVYLAARERGLRIPADLSVVGFDDLDLAPVLAPPLTTIAADGSRLGAMAFAALAERMAGRRVRRRVLPVALTVRGSTAPPPRG